jgi:hypothetical protein
MSQRYLVQIQTPTITPVIVVADSPQDARDRALHGEGKPSEAWTEEAEIKRVIKLEG